MPRATYRPHSINEDVSFTGSYGPHVGGDTALDTRDADTTYIETGKGTTPDFGTEVTFRLEPETAPPPTGATLLSLTVDMEWRATEATTSPTGIVNGFAAPGSTGSWGTVISAHTASTSYVWVEDLLAIDMNATNDFRRAMVTKLVDQEAGYYWRMFTAVPATGTFAYGRVTYLRVHVYYEGGLRPLQHRQRTDAYGVGGVQAARTRTTFQSGMGARYPV